MGVAIRVKKRKDLKWQKSVKLPEKKPSKLRRRQKRNWRPRERRVGKKRKNVEKM